MPESPTISASAPSRGKAIAMWMFRIFVAVMFLPFATFHLFGWFGWEAYMASEFDLIGLGQWLRYFTGGLEILGVLLVLTPRTSALGGLVLLTVDIGAFVAEVTVLHVDWVHCVIYAAILVPFIYFQRHTLPFRRSAGSQNRVERVRIRG